MGNAIRQNIADGSQKNEGLGNNRPFSKQNKTEMIISERKQQAIQKAKTESRS